MTADDADLELAAAARASLNKAEVHAQSRGGGVDGGEEETYG
jgi:hypothetical protein